MSPITALVNNDEDAAITPYQAGELDRTELPSGPYVSPTALLAEAGFGPDKALTLTLNYNTSYGVKPDLTGLPKHDVMQFWHAKDLYRIKQ